MDDDFDDVGAVTFVDPKSARGQAIMDATADLHPTTQGDPPPPDDLDDLIALAEEVAQPDFLETYAAIKTRLAEAERAGRVLAEAVMQVPSNVVLVEHLRAALVAAMDILQASKKE